MVKSIDSSAQFSVPAYRALGEGHHSLGERSDVTPERLADDIEVPARAVLGLGDPDVEMAPRPGDLALEVAPRLGDLGPRLGDLALEVTPGLGDQTVRSRGARLDVFTDAALEPIQRFAHLWVHGATLAVRPRSVNATDRIPSTSPWRRLRAVGPRRGTRAHS